MTAGTNAKTEHMIISHNMIISEYMIISYNM
eukprot:SAG31_NODE_28578_length_408_cov_0.660194_1_plen_30_part_10